MLRQFFKSPVSDDSRTQLAQAPRIVKALGIAASKGAEEAKDGGVDGLKAEFHQVTLATRFTKLLLWLMVDGTVVCP